MTSNIDLRSARALTLGSGCKLVFIKKESGRIIPALMLIGIEAMGQNGASRVWQEQANGCVGIITSEITTVNNEKTINTHFKTDPVIITPYNDENSEGANQETDWLIINPDVDKIVYPRIFINSLEVKTDSDQLVVKYQDYEQQEINEVPYATLKPYKDYSVLTRSLESLYVITLDNEVVIKKGLYGNYNGIIDERNAMINYCISNANTSIYLDALEIAKENSQPKVSYEVTPNLFGSEYCETIYNKIGNIIRINDNDLKFKDTYGYISGFSLDLDHPDNDVVDVKNYKTKFEDLFSTITAETQAMKKNSHLLDIASNAFTSSGDISESVLQSSIFKVDLNYAFDNGKLTIDENNGIWGTSDTGVVAFRGGGIFTSTEQDASGNWKWNTGITPEGINASLITSGQLDTNLIKIYAGDHLRFQMNSDGIFAYKSWMNDVQTIRNDDGTVEQSHPKWSKADAERSLELQEKINKTQQQQNEYTALQKKLAQANDVSAQDSLDGKQYVLFNEEGLALIAKKGAKILNAQKTDYLEVLEDQFAKDNNLIGISEIKRVEVSWDGFILRNLRNEKVFYAQPQSGDLTLKGTINANSGTIGTWMFDKDMLWAPGGIDTEGNYTIFTALNAGGQANKVIYNNNGQVITNSVDTHNYVFWAGNPDPQKAHFSIQKNGYLTAASGKIGSWHLNSDKLYSDNITLATTAAGVTIKYRTVTDIKRFEGGDPSYTFTTQSKTYKTKAVFWCGDKQVQNSKFKIFENGDAFISNLYLQLGSDNQNIFVTLDIIVDRIFEYINKIYSTFYPITNSLAGRISALEQKVK